MYKEKDNNISFNSEFFLVNSQQFTWSTTSPFIFPKITSFFASYITRKKSSVVQNRIEDWKVLDLRLLLRGTC